MNMQGSLSKSSYNDVNKEVNSSYAGNARESMENTAHEVG